MNHIALVNGPNLNLLGLREPQLYGKETLADVEARFQRVAAELGVEVSCFQSNSEGALIDHLHGLRGKAHAIVFNAGAYTHTSIALRDAVLATEAPLYEVHISNVFKREAFRHHSTLSDIAAGVVVGFGVRGYEYALREAVARLRG